MGATKKCEDFICISQSCQNCALQSYSIQQQTAISLSKVWLITDCSSGFGSDLTKAALARGDKVIAIGRNIAKLEHLKTAGVTTLALHITWGGAKVQKVTDEALKIYGMIDILVNNASYVLDDAVEECSDEEVKALFETNVFGQLTVICAVLPHMCSCKSGVITVLGSFGGWYIGPGASLYYDTKFALVGIMEALRLEVAQLGIKVMIIEPGHFRPKSLVRGTNSVEQKLSMIFGPSWI